MEKSIKDSWWLLLYRLADELSAERIPYHFDASTSLFVHGIDFDMDDIDIMVQWDYFEKVYDYFLRYGASSIETSSFSHFFFFIDGMKVHIMSSERARDLSKDKERIRIEKDGHVLWSKVVEFYRRHHSNDHPLAGLIDKYLYKRNGLK